MNSGLHNWIISRSGTLLRGSLDVLDILVVAYLIYHVMMLARGTRAWQIITGLVVFGLILWFSSWAQLTALNWVLKQMFVLGPVAIVILFYPELRHVLEEVGRLGFWGRGFTGLDKEDLTAMVGELARTAELFSSKRIGALIVLERETGLTEFIETGTVLNADVSAELLSTIFYPGGPLHDGAVIIRRDRIVAAGCTLPLSENRDIGAQVHTRHKAALGISEQSDAVVLVVSEETGIISTVVEGRMVRGQNDTLRDRLVQMYLGRERFPTPRRRPFTRSRAQDTPRPPSAVPVVMEAAEERKNVGNPPAAPPSAPPAATPPVREASPPAEARR